MRWSILLLVACSSTPHAALDGGRDAAADAAPAATADEIVAACEVDDACAIHASGANGTNDCLRYWTSGRPLLRPEWVHCMAAAHGNCAMARACAGQTLTSSTTCSPGATTCAGTHLVTCIGTLGNAVQLDTDCASLDYGSISGNTCISSGSSATCGLGTCTGEACMATAEVRCNGTVEQAFDCAPYGETCIMGASRSECAGTGAACTAPRVDGNTIVYCTYGFEHAVDCATAVPGGTVQVGTTSMQGTTSYCGLAAACQPAAGGETCSGTTLTLCVFGAVQTFDCTALGYTGCDTSARCKPSSLL